MVYGPCTLKVHQWGGRVGRLSKHLNVEANEANTMSSAYPVKNSCIPPGQRLLSRCGSDAGNNGQMEHMVVKGEEVIGKG